jgi:hypothetical protein
MMIGPLTKEDTEFLAICALPPVPTFKKGNVGAVSITLAEKFHGRVDTDGECWIWTASRNKNGYGRINHNYKNIRAHRASWIITRGPIPKGIDILHKCDNPACVRPSHHFPGNMSINQTDRAMKGRHRNKLTPAQVRELRGVIGIHGAQRAFARKYSVSEQIVSDVARGRVYRWVE